MFVLSILAILVVKISAEITACGQKMVTQTVSKCQGRPIPTDDPYLNSVVARGADYVIIGKETCPWCRKAKAQLDEKNLSYEYISLTEFPATYQKVADFLNYKYVPIVIYKGAFIGGYSELVSCLTEKVLQTVQQPNVINNIKMPTPCEVLQADATNPGTPVNTAQNCAESKQVCGGLLNQTAAIHNDGIQQVQVAAQPVQPVPAVQAAAVQPVQPVQAVQAAAVQPVQYMQAAVQTAPVVQNAVPVQQQAVVQEVAQNNVQTVQAQVPCQVVSVQNQQVNEAQAKINESAAQKQIVAQAERQLALQQDAEQKAQQAGDLQKQALQFQQGAAQTAEAIKQTEAQVACQQQHALNLNAQANALTQAAENMQKQAVTAAGEVARNMPSTDSSITSTGIVGQAACVCEPTTQNQGINSGQTVLIAQQVSSGSTSGCTC